MTQEAIDLLTSIDRTLKILVGLVSPLVQQAKAAAPKSVASDRDLDSKYGDPLLKFQPRDWAGPSFKGRPFSACPPDLLEMVAETLDYFAGQAEAKNELTNTGKPVAPYKRADAARARGWAKRIREGRAPGPRADEAPSGVQSVPSGWTAEGSFADDDIPF